MRNMNTTANYYERKNGKKQNYHDADNATTTNEKNEEDYKKEYEVYILQEKPRTRVRGMYILTDTKCTSLPIPIPQIPATFFSSFVLTPRSSLNSANNWSAFPPSPLGTIPKKSSK